MIVRVMAVLSKPGEFLTMTSPADDYTHLNEQHDYKAAQLVILIY